MEAKNKIFETMPVNRLFFRCAVPNVISMAVISLYTIADGIFVGHFIGKEALAAINVVMPVIMISFALSDMIAIGSSVQIAIKLGEKKEEEARAVFTSSVLLIEVISVLAAAAGFFAAESVLFFIGADAQVTALGAEYVKVYAAFAPLIMIYFAADNYLRICGWVRYSMVINVSTALLNVVLDYIFVGVMGLGVWAAAFASCIGLTLGTLLSFAPFLAGRLPLRFTRGRNDRFPLHFIRDLAGRGVTLNVVYNGSSEFFSNIASSVMMMTFNVVLLRLEGSLAVAAFSVVSYVDSVVVSALYGITDSMQPAISYCYGAGLKKRMIAIEKRALAACALTCLATFFFMRVGGEDLIALFVKEGEDELLAMSKRAMELFSFTYFICWIGQSLSEFFTAVNRPGISLSISLGRSLFFPAAAMLALVRFLGLDGVWLTSAAGNLLTAALALGFFARFLRGFDLTE